MKLPKEFLIKKITSICDKLDQKRTQELTVSINEKYGISLGTVSDILNLRIDLDYQNDFILYAILDGLAENSLPEFFTDAEISRYSKTRYEKENPVLTFEVVRIDKDQYIGKITAKKLIELRDAQIIRYNTNTQRTLTRVIRGMKESFKITINKIMIEKIIESYKNGNYIPNTITLNVAEDATCNYNPDTHILTIMDAEYLDIIDGFHRYLSLSQMSNLNPEFDYPMELRITQFPEEKSQHFIWQEDQKTKMKKTDSDSMNQDNPGTQIAEMLNQNGIFRNLISRNGGIIDFPLLSTSIAFFYFRDYRSKPNRSDLILVRNEIRSKLESIVECNPDLLNKRWDYWFQLYAIGCCRYYDDDINSHLEECRKYFKKRPCNNTLVDLKEANKNLKGGVKYV